MDTACIVRVQFIEEKNVNIDSVTKKVNHRAHTRYIVYFIHFIIWMNAWHCHKSNIRF